MGFHRRVCGTGESEAQWIRGWLVSESHSRGSRGARCLNFDNHRSIDRTNERNVPCSWERFFPHRLNSLGLVSRFVVLLGGRNGLCNLMDYIFREFLISFLVRRICKRKSLINLVFWKFFFFLIAIWRESDELYFVIFKLENYVSLFSIWCIKALVFNVYYLMLKINKDGLVKTPTKLKYPRVLFNRW